MTAIYLENATYVDWQSLEIRSGSLKVEEGPGGTVSSVKDIPASARRLDCRGRLVTKSFAIGHHHAYSALARGMPSPAKTPRSFVEILKLVWWNLDKKLDQEMLRASALAVAVEAALCGSTFIIDHHSSPNAAEGSLHVIAEAFEEVGLGHLLCYELSDRDGPERMQAGIEETDAYLDGHQGMVGLHASFTVSDQLLAQAVDLARKQGCGIHIHVAEAASDQEQSHRVHGKSVVDRLDGAEVLSLSQTLLVHCLHLNDRERDLVRDSKAWVVQNSESNRNNNVGTFDPRGLGDKILLGTDGMHSDMLASARAAFLDGQATGGLSPLEAYRRLRRVHDYLRGNWFDGDSDNSLVILDYPSPTPITSENWPAHMVYGLRSAHVRTVLSSGRVIVDDRQVTSVDSERILAHAREQATRLWEKL